MKILQVNNLYSDELLGGFALENITFNITVGSKIALMGQTGSGKSTLLKTIAGFIQHKSGTIFFDDKKVLGPNFQLVAGEKGIAYLSQHFELRNNYRMEELFEYANEDFTTEQTEELFKLCKVDHLLKRKSTELSGGEKQRIALTRLLLTKPKLLILDEPYSNLDLIHKTILKEVIDNVASVYNITCLLCSHDANDILPWASELLIMENGKITQQGLVKELYTNPINNTVAAVLGDFVKINSTLQKAFNIQSVNYLRPHNFCINPTGKFKGAIKKCFYYGSYFKLEVEFEGEILIMNSIENFEVGSVVFFNLKTNK